VGPGIGGNPKGIYTSFNPSVGILWGGTCTKALVPVAKDVVSIPRSGFCGVGPLHSGDQGAELHVVSIPRSGFCGVGHGRIQASGRSWSVSIPRSGFCGVGRRTLELL